VKITPPFGYDDIIPLKKTHRVLIPHGVTPSFCRGLNALAVTYSEFVPAGRDYPVVFASIDEGKSFAPVVVLGLKQGENLFVDGSGNWEGTRYLPAFVRRYPFCISKVYVDGKPNSEKVVCIAKAYVDAAGLPLYESDGQATQQWRQTEALLQEYEKDLDLTAQMCDGFAKLELFQPFVMQVMHNDTPQFELKGMYRVDETKLKALKPSSHKALVTKGWMGKIYAHFHSLERFADLYNRVLSRRRAVQSAARKLTRLH
jgi:hypothetical protein